LAADKGPGRLASIGLSGQALNIPPPDERTRPRELYRDPVGDYVITLNQSGNLKVETWSGRAGKPGYIFYAAPTAEYNLDTDWSTAAGEFMRRLESGLAPHYRKAVKR